jgi:hypothetical protein
MEQLRNRAADTRRRAGNHDVTVTEPLALACNTWFFHSSSIPSLHRSQIL